MIVGISNVAGMILLLTAFRGGITGIVSAINAMSVVLVIFYARFYLKEVMSRHEVIGLIVAIGGIVVLRVTS